jgi:hypothetical protein
MGAMGLGLMPNPVEGGVYHPSACPMGKRVRMPSDMHSSKALFALAQRLRVNASPSNGAACG